VVRDHHAAHPGQNDSDAELDAMTRGSAEHLGPDVPLHFTAFHPDFKMLDARRRRRRR
jgi:pyruvate formate lyase activating enzyme